MPPAFNFFLYTTECCGSSCLITVRVDLTVGCGRRILISAGSLRPLLLIILIYRDSLGVNKRFFIMIYKKIDSLGYLAMGLYIVCQSLRCKLSEPCMYSCLLSIAVSDYQVFHYRLTFNGTTPTIVYVLLLVCKIDLAMFRCSWRLWLI